MGPEAFFHQRFSTKNRENRDYHILHSRERKENEDMGEKVDLHDIEKKPKR